MDIRVTKDGSLSWKETTLSCALGKGGLTDNKIEGDGKTPIGSHILRRVFYRPDRLQPPQTGLPILALDKSDGWCDDPSHPDYNTHVRLPHPARFEEMWREDGLYDLVVEIGYNDNPVKPNKGSAIFMHVAKPGYKPTEGCVALALPDLLGLLKDCQPGDQLCIKA